MYGYKILFNELSKAKKSTFNFTISRFKNHNLLSCVINDEEKLTDISPQNIPIETVSIIFDFTVSFNYGEITENDYNNNSVLILPLYLENLAEEMFTELEHLFRNFLKHSAKDSASDYVYCYSIFFRLLAKIDELVRKYNSVTNEKMYNYYIKKTNSIINSRYNQKLTLDIVSKELGISSGYLSSIYKKITGISFNKHLVETRLNHAKELVLTTTLSTQEIAEKVGFTDESYFRKVFKKFFGMNIREYSYTQKGI